MLLHTVFNRIPGGVVHIRSNTVGLGKFLLVVDIDLRECDGIGTRELGGQRIIGGRNSLAWPAPVGVDYSSTKRTSAMSSLFGWL